MENFPLPCLIIGGYQVYVLNHLHGKRLIERRLFFPTVASSLSLCFLRDFCVCPFFGPSQILHKLLCFINVVSVSVYLFLSQALQDVSLILIDFVGTR